MITITGSKSISNRILLLFQLMRKLIPITNLSTSDDTRAMIEALSSNQNNINVGLAGSTMRFLTAYFSIQDGREIILGGEEHLNRRPIKELVDALQSLGANITYLKNTGYPPLLIKGVTLLGGRVMVKSDVSSQFVTALLLIAPFLEKGLEIVMTQNPVSFSYIQTTLDLLKSIGVRYSTNGNIITVHSGYYSPCDQYLVESDWSSASYYYSLISLSGKSKQLQYFFQDSIQADRRVADIYSTFFGVNTYFDNGTILLQREKDPQQYIHLDLIHNPDIAQTIAVNCFGLRRLCKLTGLQTLKIKETDRLSALKQQLSQLGAEVHITDDSLEILAYKDLNIDHPIQIKTYKDHRMAMSFAPLIALGYNISFDDKSVVSKSYREFWEDFKL